MQLSSQKLFNIPQRKMTILETERLFLREFREDDLDALFAILSNEEVMRFSLKGPLSKKETQEYLQNRILKSYSQNGFGLWAIILKENGSLIGFAGLVIQPIDGKEFVELGYRLH